MLAMAAVCPPLSLILWLFVDVQVMDKLGSSLWDIWNLQNQKMSQQYVACVAVEAITILEDLHKKG